MSNLRLIANLILFKTSRNLLQNDHTSGDPQCFGQFLPKIYNLDKFNYGLLGDV